MASKSFSVNDSNNRYTLTLTLTEGTQSIAKNQTPLSYKLVLKANTAYNFELYKIGRTVTLNGTTVYNVARSNSASLSIADYGSLTLAEGSTTITHNADGTKTISVAFSIDMASASYTPGPMSGTGSMTLTTIARATQPTLSPSSVTMDKTMTINLPRAASTFTHDVYYTFGGAKDKLIKSGATTSASWPVLLDLASQIPNAPSGTGTITVVTKNNGSAIGTKTAPFTATVPDNADTKPTCSFEIEPTGNPSWVNGYVQGRTKVKATIKSSFKFGTSAKSYRLSVNGVVSDSSSNAITSGAINKPGSVSVKASVTDKRGFTSTESEKTIPVYPYAKPTIIKHPKYGTIVCQRCKSDGTLFDSGTNLFLRMRCKWSSLANGENTATLKYNLVDGNGASIGGTIKATASGGGADNKYSSWYDLNQVLMNDKDENVTISASKTWLVTITITDGYGEKDSLEFAIPTEDVALHLGENGNKAAFGKYAEKDKTLEIAKDWDLMMKEKIVQDFVISRSTSAIAASSPRAATTWYITKWNSGFVELHARAIFSNVAIVDTWGSCFSAYLDGSSLAYPVTFKALPICQVTVETATGGDAWVTGCDKVAPATTKTPMFQLVRPNSKTLESIVLDYYVRGFIEED